jgi:hypothetical protein
LNINDYDSDELNYKIIMNIYTPNCCKVIPELLNDVKVAPTSIYNRRIDYIFYKNINNYYINYYNTSNFKKF